MNKILSVIMICTLMIVATTSISRAADRELVLIDTDMVDIFDDGVAMMMLAKSPNVKVLGVTTVTGNTWSQDGAASAIRQLEGISVSDVPVVVGDTPKYVRKRFANINNEIDEFGFSFEPPYFGAAALPEPSDWRDAYRKNYNAEPTMETMKASAADFIILMVRAHPNELTIVEIGPCTNLAAAIKKAPDIVPLIKRVVYMGGAFFVNGNTTPSAEFNIWFDPIAARQVVRSPFNEQIFVPLDACDKVVISRDQFNTLRQKINSPILAAMMDRKGFEPIIDENHTFIWDVLAAAIVIDPSIIVSEETHPIDVNDTYSLSYGQTLAYSKAPRGTQSARIVTEIDRTKLDAMLDALFSSI